MRHQQRHPGLGELAQLLGPAVLVTPGGHDDCVERFAIEQCFPVVELRGQYPAPRQARCLRPAVVHAHGGQLILRPPGNRLDQGRRIGIDAQEGQPHRCLAVPGGNWRLLGLIFTAGKLTDALPFSAIWLILQPPRDCQRTAAAATRLPFRERPGEGR